jgi:hypothetical protein
MWPKALERLWRGGSRSPLTPPLRPAPPTRPVRSGSGYEIYGPQDAAGDPRIARLQRLARSLDALTPSVHGPSDMAANATSAAIVSATAYAATQLPNLRRISLLELTLLLHGPFRSVGEVRAEPQGLDARDLQTMSLDLAVTGSASMIVPVRVYIDPHTAFGVVNVELLMDVDEQADDSREP